MAVFLCLNQVANAGFLEMPDTTEVPEMERNSMLKDLDIPPIRDRDPDPMAGPRLNITEFRVQGIVEYPELGITRRSLMDLVEGIRFDMMGEGEMLESGYTLDEVSEISDLIADIEEETQGDHVSPLDLQRLVFLIRDQRRRRGVTLGMVEAVADTITRYYRERGFILAKAYIPEQRVRDGVVNLTLLLGNLGEVKVHNNHRYTKETITQIFEHNINKPVKADVIEEKLFFVNDLPGLSAQAFFEPGSQVGDTKLSINVLDEDLFSSNLRFDNHGSENTGEYRMYADVYWSNPVGFGDQLHMGLLATMDPSNSLYGSLHYGIPVFNQKGKWTVGGSTNDFISNSITGFSVTGTSTVVNTSLNFILQRSRVQNYSLELRASEVATDIEQEIVQRGSDIANPNTNTSAQGDLDSQVRNIDLVFNFDVLLEKIRALHQGGMRITYGEFIDGQGANQKKNQTIFAANYSFLKFVKFPFTNVQTRAVFKLSGQYAEGSVPSISQFGLAGPNKMRALSINQYNADAGIYGAVDWVFNWPKSLSWDFGGEKLSDMLQPYVFYEAAYGDASPPVSGEGTWLGVTDIGLGLKFAMKNSFRASFNYAKVVNYLQDTGSPDRNKEQDLEETDRIYFDLQYSF